MKNLINQILESQEILDHQNRVVENARNQAVEEGRHFTEWAEKMERFAVVFDLVRSLGKYTKPTDRVIEFHSANYNGSIEITAKIERDGKSYYFSTSLILAGGYNVQVLHVRYLTDTNLPKDAKSALVIEWNNKRKAMNKVDRKREDVERLENYISEEELRLIERTAKSKNLEQVWLDSEYSKWTWNEGCTMKEGAEYDAFISKIKADQGQRVFRDIENSENRIKSLNRDLIKESKKLENLTNEMK